MQSHYLLIISYGFLFLLINKINYINRFSHIDLSFYSVKTTAWSWYIFLLKDYYCLFSTINYINRFISIELF